MTRELAIRFADAYRRRRCLPASPAADARRGVGVLGAEAAVSAETRTERVVAAALMVRTFATVTPEQAAACLRVSVAEVQIALGRWTNMRWRA